jgi:hypothetical protein
MSTPFVDCEDPIQGALNEVVSTISALNMEAEPIPGASGYLSQTDAMAKHAMEHLHAVFVLIQRAEQQREKDRIKIWRLEIALHEATSQGDKL